MCHAMHNSSDSGGGSLKLLSSPIKNCTFHVLPVLTV